jgi:hypothetical protein
MSRISIVMSTAMLAVLALPVNAAEQTFKQQIQGAWNLVSCEAKTPACVNPSGSLSLNGNGRYTFIVVAKGRPKATTTGGREAVTPEEYKAVAKGVVANFGTWTANEADKTIAYHVEGALFPNTEGSDGKSTVVSVTADEMKTSGQAIGNATYRRFK